MSGEPPSQAFETANFATVLKRMLFLLAISVKKVTYYVIKPHLKRPHTSVHASLL